MATSQATPILERVLVPFNPCPKEGAGSVRRHQPLLNRATPTSAPPWVTTFAVRPGELRTEGATSGRLAYGGRGNMPRPGGTCPVNKNTPRLAGPTDLSQ